MRTARSLPYGGVSPGGSLSRESLSRRVSIQVGFSVRGVSVQEGLCPGGFLSRGFLSREVSVQGISVRETPSPVDRQMPMKIIPCPILRLRAVKIAYCTTIITHQGYILQLSHSKLQLPIQSGLLPKQKRFAPAAKVLSQHSATALVYPFISKTLKFSVLEVNSPFKNRFFF